MSEQIISVIDELGKRFGVVIDWTQESVLPYVEELCSKYVRYEIATSAALCIMTLTATAISAVIFYKALKKLKEIEYDGFLDFVSTVSGILTVAFLFVSILCVPIQIKDIITCLTLPEKMILEYVQSLLG